MSRRDEHCDGGMPQVSASRLPDRAGTVPADRYESATGSMNEVAQLAIARPGTRLAKRWLAAERGQRMGRRTRRMQHGGDGTATGRHSATACIGSRR